MNKTNVELPGMDLDDAREYIELFGEKFGHAHLYFAQHAAFPLALTPDLLYRLWVNFQRNYRDDKIIIPWIAVADLLLSPLCKEVGHELYEMDLTIRAELLNTLKNDETLGMPRIYELSNFLLEYVRQQLSSGTDVRTAKLANAQRWTALAYTQPGKVAQELREALTTLSENLVEQAHLVLLWETLNKLAEPLANLEDFVPISHILNFKGEEVTSGRESQEALMELPLLRNPYFDNNVVRDLSMLFGRDYELHLIYDMLEKKQSISLIGSRHIGKSSLLQYVGSPALQQRLGYDLQPYIFVLLDLRDYYNKTQDDFFRAAYEQTVTQYQESSSSDSPMQTWQDQFEKVLRDIHASGLHTVLLLDTFDRVVQNEAFDFKFFSSLRSLATQQLVSYVTTSVKVYDSPFLTIFHVCPLGPLTAEEARQLVVVPAERVACPFSNEEVAWILKQAGRHPFFLQVTSRFLFAEKYQQQHAPVDLNRVQERVYSELLPCFNDIVERLPQAELVREAQVASKATRKMAELSESALFRRYVHERFGETDITVKDIKEALDNLANTTFLETTKLATTYYVMSRYEQASASVGARKGGIVRDFLRAAFTRMRLSGTRSDSALEWGPYNILYYHYFQSQYRVSNEQIVARLGIRSRRQFYREQEEAIQLLLKEVCTLEKMALEGKQT